MNQPSLLVPILATLAAIIGAIVGLSLAGVRGNTRVFVGFGGGLLLGVAVFGLVPELVDQISWAPTAVLFAAGYFLLRVIDRNLYPVCPSCSHDHDHDACSTELHGFAAPLILATACHAFLDGWSIATSQWAGAAGIVTALPLALALHKIPEGIALGALLRASIHARVSAFGWCVVTELTTVLGAGSGLAIAPIVGTRWLHYPLAIAGGCFFYLGFHAIHGEWQRRKTWSAFVPGLTGAAGAAIIMWQKL